MDKQKYPSTVSMVNRQDGVSEKTFTHMDENGNAVMVDVSGKEVSEALTGVLAALLTVYDMCKAIDKRMEISGRQERRIPL